MGYEPTTHCNTCEEPFDVYREPGYRRCDTCIDALVTEYKRAGLGVDGNAGFALIGADLQAGEAEFVSIEDAPDWAKTTASRESWAATQAYQKLQKRLGRTFSYYLGPSHPRYV